MGISSSSLARSPNPADSLKKRDYSQPGPKPLHAPVSKASQPEEKSKPSKGSQGFLAGVQAGAFEDIDLRDDADEPDYVFAPDKEGIPYSSRPGQADHPRKYESRTEQQGEDEEYDVARREVSGESDEPFEQIPSGRKGEQRKSAHQGQGDRADKYS